MHRRLTDRSLPSGLESVSPDANLFNDLLEMEKQLDWTMTRRRQEITDTLNRGTMQTKRTLRVFMSHSVQNQAWQKDGNSQRLEGSSGLMEDSPGANPSFETGDGVPSWTFKIEGKLLQPESIPTPKRWPVPQRKFSHMIKSLSIEMDRDPSVYPDTNHVQWIDRGNWGSYNAIGAYVAGLNKQPGDSSTSGTENPAEGLNGFALTRHGDVPTRLRVSLHLNHNPERVKVNGQLAAIIGMYEDTRPNVLNAFWHYVKSNGLQDKNDRKLIKLDDRLRGVFKYETLNFQDIPTLVVGQLTNPDPLVLSYEVGVHHVDSAGSTDTQMADPSNPAPMPSGGIGVNDDGQSAVKAFDIDLDLDDIWMRARAGEVMLSLQPDSVALGMGVTLPPSNTFMAIQKADDELKHALQSLRELRIRRDFFGSLAENPSSFIQNFVNSQARDLEVVLGNERAAEQGGAGGSLGGLSSGFGGGVRETDLATTEFFQKDWVYEAVGIHEGIRMGSAVAAMHHAAQQQANMQAMGGMTLPAMPLTSMR